MRDYSKYGIGTTPTAIRPTAYGITPPEIAPLVREDPWWKDWVTDPLFWTLEKINRPQQALFAYAHETMRGGAGGKAAWDAFTKGGDVRFVDLLDDVGLRGQAGSFDMLDVVAAGGELFLDPANLIGIGGKVGKLSKFAELTTDEAKILPTLQRLGLSIDDIRKANLPLPGELGTRVANEARRLMGPDAFSHYINIGAGGMQYSIPGSNRLLEPIIKAGRGVRGFFRGSLSTQPLTIEQAIPQALRNVIEKQKSGANQFISMLSRQLPKEWQEGALANAIEIGHIADDAPEAVQDAYELGSWYSKHLPDLEEMSGVMTRKYGEGGPEFPKA